MQKSPVFTIITGASQGLGSVLAIECARRGRHLILLALPDEGLPDLAARLTADYGIQAFYYETNLAHEGTPQAFYEWVIEQNLPVCTLINNAGIGGTLRFTQATPAYLDNIILLNIRALALLTRLFVPLLQMQPTAHILNISSMAAFSPIPFKTVYPASKAFVYSFSMGLREELRDSSVRVSVLHPGPMATTADNTARIQRHSALAQHSALSVEQVAATALKGMEQGKGLIIPGWLNKISYRLMGMVPHNLQVPILRRIFTKELPLYHV
ncbi:MAG TPA: SDR family NAD(P)-dependent oxidoreductase [Saprospiraceae bacterium]|nr:SDR family NAD(P)-dependent oxidoreductase [Saprospiraceae bacterium]HMP25141.1 SDR family NAD(P)-dependent oxidoreductase [Saprospiraceae bacterium]